MIDNLADYESELDPVQLLCSYKNCDDPATHRVVHACGWGALACKVHALQFRAYMPMLRRHAAIGAAEGKQQSLCQGCNRIVTYDGDFTTEEIIQ